MVFTAILMISVRKLTIGIRMSTFALLLLEYAGKRFISCFRPCSIANIAFKYFSGRVSNSILFKSLVSVLKKRKDREGSESATIQESTICSKLVYVNLYSFGEIEIVETMIMIKTDIHIDEINSLKLNKDQKWEDSKCKAIDREQCEISECKTKGRFKVMLKKLVPKKLRNKRKEK